jgi:Fe2+ transport system protein B
MQTQFPATTPDTLARRVGGFRLTIRQWMIAVAGTAALFAAFGVNTAVGTVIVAFFVSALFTMPEDRQAWVVLLLAAVAALPMIHLASLYTFACRAALFLGHWPSYNNPDPTYLPDEFQPQTEFLAFVIPTIISVAVTCLFATLVARFASRSRRIAFALTPAILLYVFSYLVLLADPLGVLDWLVD